MNDTKETSFIILGLALFSMFFGGGNLIFPLQLGVNGGDFWMTGTLGFILSGVFLPLLGVISILRFEGNVTSFFSLMGKWPAFLFRFLLLTFWIPLGSSPRCITLSYEGARALFSSLPFAAFSAFFCLLTYFCLFKKSAFIEILGKFLTPVLLFLLLGVLVAGVSEGGFESISREESIALQNYQVQNFSEAFWLGLKMGYNTMDLIASFFFVSSILSLLGHSKRKKRIIVKASCLALFILTSVYSLMIFVASLYAPAIWDIPSEKLFLILSEMILGEKAKMAVALTVTLACFGTLMALTRVYGDFLKMMKVKEKSGIVGILMVSFFVSLFGLKGITSITSPMMEVFYPTLLLFIIISFFRVPKS